VSSNTTPRVYGPREKQLNVRLPEKTHKLIALLADHHGLPKAGLFEYLVDQAAQAARLEIAARAEAARKLPPADVIDEQDEPDGSPPPTLDAEGRFQPWWKT